MKGGQKFAKIRKIAKFFEFCQTIHYSAKKFTKVADLAKK